MDYFSDLMITAAAHIPDCRVFIDRSFKDYFSLNYMASGRISFRIKGAEAVVLEGPVAWVLYPDQHFEYGLSECDRKLEGAHWDHRYVSFCGERVERFINSGLLTFDRDHPIIPIFDESWMTRVFDETIQVCSGLPEHQKYEDHKNIGTSHLKVQDCSRLQALERLLLTLQLQSERAQAWTLKQSKGDKERLGKDALDELLRQMDHAPHVDLDFEQVAAQHKVSYSYFRKHFKLYTGVAPKQYVLSRRLHLAAGLLLRSRAPVQEVAREVGIEDAFHFSKLFKKTFQLTPTEYREQLSFDGG